MTTVDTFPKKPMNKSGWIDGTAASVDVDRTGKVGRIRGRRTAAVTILSLIFILLTAGGCTSKSEPERPAASPQLHLVAVLYGKYISAHDGQMPPDQDALVRYVESSEQDVLMRRGLKSAEEIFAPPADRPRIVVLYRDPRERLGTNYVAIEEQRIDEEQAEGQQATGQNTRRRWLAADVLGVGEEITEVEADRILAETGEAADKI